MTRTLSVVCAALFALTPQLGTSAQVAETVDDPEAYAVYTAVLTRLWNHSYLKNVGNLLILQETQETAHGYSLGCDAAFKDPAWQLVRDSYDAQNAHGRILLPKLALDVPYTLGSSATLAPLLREVRNRYLPLSLSAVGFDRPKSRAYLTVHLGNSRHLGIPLVKKDGLWIDPPGVPHCTLVVEP